MIRLTVISQTEEEAVLKVEGRASGANVALLGEEGARLLREAERLVLDMKDVKLMDREGIALLQQWAGERLRLRQPSAHLRILLAQHGLEQVLDVPVRSCPSCGGPQLPNQTGAERR